MAQIQSPETYADGQQVTASRLNNQTNGAVLLPGAVTDQTALAAGTVASGDQVILHDASATALRKATAGDLLGSGLPITTGVITGSAGADLIVTPAAGQKVDVNGAFESTTSNTTGNSTIGGNQTVTGNLAVTGTTTMTGNATASGNLAVTGSLTAGGNPVQRRVDVAILTREIASGVAYNETVTSTWLDGNFNTIAQTNPFVVNAASFTNVVGSTGSATITLPAGTYDIEGHISNVSGGGSGFIVFRVRNETTGVQIKKGNVGKCGGFANGESIVRCIATLATETSIKLQYMVSAVGTLNYPISDGTSEQLFVVRITKLA